MRLIKFRAKDMFGDWLFGDLQHYIGGRSGIRAFKDRHGFEVNPETVGQFTGAYDINGKEIYEGDILESAEKPDSYSFGFWEETNENSDYGFTGHCGKIKISGKPFRRVVKWNDDRAAFWLHLPLSNTIAGSRTLKMCIEDDKMRVIGNIYDNPELEKGDENERNQI